MLTAYLAVGLAVPPTLGVSCAPGATQEDRQEQQDEQEDDGDEEQDDGDDD